MRPFWQQRRRQRRRETARQHMRQLQIPLAITRLEERRVLTVSAAVVGDVLDIDLTGANEAATISVDVNQVEIFDATNTSVFTANLTSTPIHRLDVAGNGDAGQRVVLESPTGQSLELVDGGAIRGVDSVRVELEVNAASDFSVQASGVVTIGATGELDTTAGGLLEIGSADVSISATGLIRGTDIYFTPVAGVTVGLGDNAAGAYRLDSRELTAGIEATGVVRIGRVGATEAMNIRDVHLSAEQYVLELHAGNVTLGGDAPPPEPLYADNTPNPPGEFDGSYTATAGFTLFNRGRLVDDDTGVTRADASGDRATWTFDGLEDGQYQVSASWGDVFPRTSGVPYTISGTGIVTQTVLVDQREILANTGDFSDAVGNWKILWVVTVSGGLGNGVIEVSVSDQVEVPNANRFVLADAVRIARAEPLIPQGPDLDMGSRLVRVFSSGSVKDLVDSNLDNNALTAGQAEIHTVAGIGSAARALPTQLGSVAATATSSGGVYLSNSGPLAVASVGALNGIVSTGPVQVTASGTIDVQRTVATTAGSDIQLLATQGDIVFGADVHSGSVSGAGMVRATSQLGGLVGGAGAARGASARLQANASIGADPSPVLIDVDRVEAQSAAGAVFLAADRGVTIGLVDAGLVGIQAPGRIRVTGQQHIEVAEGVTGLGVELAAAGDLRILAAVHSQAALTLTSGVDIVQAAVVSSVGAASLAAGRDLQSQENVSSGAALSLAAGQDLRVVKTASSQAAALTARGGRDVRLDAASRLANNGGALIEVEADTAPGAGGGQIVMQNGAVIDGSSGRIRLLADGDITLSHLVTLGSHSDAVRVVSDSGALRDGGDAALEILAAAGGAELQAALGIGAADPLEIRVAQLDASNTAGGAVRIVEQDALQIVRLVQSGSGDTSVTASGLLTVTAAGAGVSADSGATLLEAIGVGARLQVDGAVRSTSGGISLRAGGDAQFGAAAAVSSLSGQVGVTASVASPGGRIVMADGAALDTGGRVLLTASGDIVVAHVASGHNNASGNAIVVRTAGAVVDGGDSGVDFAAPLGRLDIEAGTGIGAADPLETDARQLRAIASTGAIKLSDLSGIELDEVRQLSSGTIDIGARGPLVVSAAMPGVAGGLVKLTASAAVDANIEVNGLVASQSSELRADNDVSFGAAGRVDAAGGAVLIRADESAGANGGRLVMADGAQIAATGTIDLAADGDVAVARVDSLSSLVNAIRVLSESGQIVDAGDSHVDLKSPGGIELTAAAGIGAGNALEVQATSALLANTGAGDVAVDNFNAADTDLRGMATVGGALTFTQSGGGALLVSGPLRSGADGAVDGGDITVIAADNLTVNALISTLDDQGRVGNLTATGMTLGAGFDLAQGAGDVSLSGGADDLLMQAAFASPGGVLLQARRDVLIRGEIETTSAAASLVLTADLDNDQAGGVLIAGAGRLESAGLIELRGADLTTTIGVVDGVAIEVDDLDSGAAQVVGQRVAIASAAAAPADSKVMVEGAVQATGLATIEANGDVLLGPHGDVAGVGVEVRAGLGAAGSVQMSQGAVVDATTGVALIVAADNVALGEVRTVGGGAAAISIDAGGAVSDANGAGMNLQAVSGGAVITSRTGVGAADPLETRVDSLSLDNEVSGDVRIAELDGLRVVLLTQRAAAGEVEIVAGGELLVSQSSSRDGDLTLQSTGGDVAVQGVVESVDGAVRIAAASAVTMTSAGEIVTTGDGSVELRADGPGGVEMAGGATARSGGRLSIESGGDVKLARLVAASAASDAVSVVAEGAIADGPGAAARIESAGGVFLDARSGIGAASAVSVQAAGQVRAVNRSAGEIQLSGDGDLQVGRVDQQAAGAAARLLATGALQIQDRVTTSQGLVDLAADAIQFAAAGAIESLGADIMAASNSSISMSDGASAQAGAGRIAFAAAGDIVVSSLQSNSGAGDAIQLTAGGAVIDGGDSAVDIVAPGGGLLASAPGGIGAGNALEVAVRALSLDAGGAAVGINGAGDLAIERLVGGEILVAATGAVVVAQGPGAPDIQGGNVSLQSLTTIDVRGDIQATGDVTLTADAAEVGGSVEAGGEARLTAAATATVSGRLAAASDVEVLAGIDVRLSDAVLASGAGDVRVAAAQNGPNGGKLEMSGTAIVFAAAGRVELLADGDVELTRVQAAGSTALDAVRIVSATGGIVVADANSINVQAPLGGAVLSAAQGIGAGVALATNVQSIDVSNTAAGDVLLLDVSGDLQLRGATQGASGGDLVVVAQGELRVTGAGVAAQGGRVALASNLGSVELSASTTTVGGEVIVDAAESAVFLVGGDIATAGGRIAVLAGTGGGGEVVMADGVVVDAGNAEIVIRAVGDVRLSGVRSSFAGPSIRIESVGGEILDNGDADLDVVAAGGVQLVAAGGVGAANPLDVAVASLAAQSAFGGVAIVSQGDLQLGAVGALAGVDASAGAVSISTEGQLSVTSQIRGGGDVALSSGRDLVVDGRVAVVAGDGDLTLTAGEDLRLNDVGGLDPEIRTTGAGIVRLRAGEQLELAPGVEIRTDTGRFASLPLVSGVNLSAVVEDQGGLPVAPDGSVAARVSVGGAGDENFLLDVTWSDGTTQRLSGVNGGETRVTSRFVGPDTTNVAVRVAATLDPRADGEGGFVNGVQLFANGDFETQIVVVVDAERSVRTLGLDSVVVTAQSTIEPVAERPRALATESVAGTTPPAQLGVYVELRQSRLQAEVQTVLRVFLREVNDSTGEELGEEKDLEEADLDDLPGIVRRYRLYDGHFRAYVQEAGSQRVRRLLDFYVQQGRIVPPNFREGSSERPPSEGLRKAPENIEPPPGDERLDVKPDAAKRPDASQGAARSTATPAGDAAGESPLPQPSHSIAAAGWITVGVAASFARRNRTSPPPSGKYSRGARLARRLRGADDTP